MAKVIEGYFSIKPTHHLSLVTEYEARLVDEMVRLELNVYWQSNDLNGNFYSDFEKTLRVEVNGEAQEETRRGLAHLLVRERKFLQRFEFQIPKDEFDGLIKVEFFGEQGFTLSEQPTNRYDPVARLFIEKIHGEHRILEEGERME